MSWVMSAFILQFREKLQFSEEKIVSFSDKEENYQGIGAERGSYMGIKINIQQQYVIVWR